MYIYIYVICIGNLHIERHAGFMSTTVGRAHVWYVVYHGLVNASMSSEGHQMNVHIMIARNQDHGSYR